jgi:hypothetical protein
MSFSDSAHVRNQDSFQDSVNTKEQEQRAIPSLELQLPSIHPMPRRRPSAPPMRMQIAQIDHSLYPPRPIQDDMMSITTNQLEEERKREVTEEIIFEEPEEEADRPEDFSPRLWQLFNRIQRRGTEPLFPADWQVPQNWLKRPFSQFCSWIS